jgi:hypothetical protein
MLEGILACHASSNSNPGNLNGLEKQTAERSSSRATARMAARQGGRQEEMSMSQINQSNVLLNLISIESQHTYLSLPQMELPFFLRDKIVISLKISTHNHYRRQFSAGVLRGWP